MHFIDVNIYFSDFFARFSGICCHVNKRKNDIVQISQVPKMNFEHILYCDLKSTGFTIQY